MALNLCRSGVLPRGFNSGKGSWTPIRAFASAVVRLHHDSSCCTYAKRESRSLLSTAKTAGHRHLSKSASLRSTESPDAVIDPTSYATKAVQLAQEAAKQPTFGVGGVLLDKKGTVLNSLHNNVIQNSRINDPTAHGERQLISWYFKNAASLPPPSDLTLVTSLDPCVMCTGAFLTSGINVAVVSHDDTAGIDWPSDQRFLSVPANLRPLAKHQFSYLGLDKVRDFAGSSSSIFYGRSIPAVLDKDSIQAFSQSAAIVHDILNKEDPTPVNIATKGPDWPSLKLLQRWWPLAASRIADINTVVGRAVLRGVLELVAAAGGGGNAAALIDPFNNILLALPQGSSPLDTPFMQLTQAYANCRKLSDPITDGTLPHPKRCRWVLLKGPGTGPTDVLDLGAYGSTMEGPVPSDIQPSFAYFLPQQSPAALKQMIANLPPLYSKIIGINPVQLPPLGH